MQHKTVGMWILSVAVGATLVGCGGVDEDQSNNKVDTGKKSGQPAQTKKTYDLAEYLFPEQNGTLVYKNFIANRDEGEDSFTDDTSDGVAQYDFTRNGSKLTIANNSEASDIVVYKLDDEQIEVTEINNSNLKYHLYRNTIDGKNYIQESPLRKIDNDVNYLNLTYTCQIDKYLKAMKVGGGNYTDILKILCSREKTTRATLDGDTLQKMTKIQEEKYASRNKGIIKEIDATCTLTKYNNEVEWEEKGCKRKTSELVTFVGK